MELANWLNEATDGLSYENNDRCNAGNACFAAGLENQEAIALLIRAGLYGSAFAIVRIIFEAYVRGIWITLCADDQEISSFLSGASPPHIRTLVRLVEAHPAYPTQQLVERNYEKLERHVRIRSHRGSTGCAMDQSARSRTATYSSRGCRGTAVRG